MTPTIRTNREKLLLNLLPAALVLAAYALIVAIPAQNKMQEKQQELKSAIGRAIDPSVAELSKQSLESAQAGLVRLNQQIKEERDQTAFLGKIWSSGDERLPTVQQVSELLVQFNLSIVNQEAQSEPVLPEYLKQLEDVLRNNSEASGPVEYWEIELAGGYQDVMKFLGEVKSSGLRTFPVTLTMMASENGDGVHSWTIVFVV